MGKHKKIKKEESRKIKKIIELISAKLEGRTTLGGYRNDPFIVLISTILSQRTRDEQTKTATDQLFEVYGTPEKIANAPIDEIERLIRPSGFYKNKAKVVKEVATIIKENNGIVPSNINELLELPGVGRKTANCVLVYGFNIPAVPVDTHVHRITNRIGLVDTNTPEETELRLRELVPREYWIVLNEILVRYGQTVCKPLGPECGDCPIKEMCEYYKNRSLTQE